MQIYVRVRPRSASTIVTRTDESSYEVRLRAVPVKGEANAQLIQVLARYFNIAPSCIAILRGKTSQHKIISLSE